jgi:hypothetical protein
MQDEVAANKEKDRVRRHHWIPKYEVEFGLQVVERHPHTGEVILAVCGLCKAFGREVREKEDDPPSPASGLRKRRRGLTTTKYFRSFRVDNIRSHLSGAHPHRWSEYQVLAKNEELRRNYLSQPNSAASFMNTFPSAMMIGTGMEETSEMDSHDPMVMAGIGARTMPPNKRAATTISTIPLPRGKPAPPLDPKTSEAQRYQLDWERLEFERMRFQREIQMREADEKQLQLRLRHEREMREKDREVELEKARLEAEKYNKLLDLLREALGQKTPNPVSALV